MSEEGKKATQDYVAQMRIMREQRDSLADVLRDIVGLARMRGAANLHEYVSLLKDADALLAEVSR